MSSQKKLLSIATASAILMAAAPILPVKAQPRAALQGPAGEVPDIQGQVDRAAAVLGEMKGDPQLASLLKLARGIFVVPNYVRAGLVVGARGGEGIMLARQGKGWTSPLFYNVGGVSVGLQAGAEAGPVVMLLMNEKAVNEFRKENNFALSADAGLTLMNYNAKAMEAAGAGDVVIWTNTQGAFATAAVGIVDIHFDDSDNRAYYRKPVKAADVLGGRVKGAKPAILEKSLDALIATR